VGIPGGTYDMGSDDGEPDEQPVHSVTVAPFEMWRTEVTVAQFELCVGEGSCGPPVTGALCNWDAVGYEDHPVNCLTWQQASDFCGWAGGRLPSEAEWEYAARSGGQDIAYPWGDGEPTCANAVMAEGDDGCGLGRSWPVCSKSAGDTDQGLCDMAGNVWEWVQDTHHEDYVGAPTDGGAWEVPASPSRMMRGGSFADSAPDLRAANRDDDPADDVVDDLGFRCAR